MKKRKPRIGIWLDDEIKNTLDTTAQELGLHSTQIAKVGIGFVCSILTGTLSKETKEMLKKYLKGLGG